MVDQQVMIVSKNQTILNIDSEEKDIHLLLLSHDHQLVYLIVVDNQKWLVQHVVDEKLVIIVSKNQRFLNIDLEEKDIQLLLLCGDHEFV